MTDITKLQFEVVESNSGFNLLTENAPFESLLGMVKYIESNGGTALVTIMGTNIEYKSSLYKGGYYLIQNKCNKQNDYADLIKL